MQPFFAAIILILVATLAICMITLIVAAGWLLVLDGDSRNRIVTEVGVNPAWKEPQFILIQTGIPLVWLACIIICFLKGKLAVPWSASRRCPASSQESQGHLRKAA
jgi:hypothetical protein